MVHCNYISVCGEKHVFGEKEEEEQRDIKLLIIFFIICRVSSSLPVFILVFPEFNDIGSQGLGVLSTMVF